LLNAYHRDGSDWPLDRRNRVGQVFSFANELDAASRLIQDVIDRYAAANAGNVIGLSIAEFDDATRRIVARQSIFPDLVDRIGKLMQQNRNIVNLRLRYVSSEVTPKRRAKGVITTLS